MYTSLICVTDLLYIFHAILSQSSNSLIYSYTSLCNDAVIYIYVNIYHLLKYSDQFCDQSYADHYTLG